MVWFCGLFVIVRVMLSLSNVLVCLDCDLLCDAVWYVFFCFVMCVCVSV